MAYQKTAHRRRRVRSYRRKNAKSRKVMRGGGRGYHAPGQSIMMVVGI